jgi:hypothetical protein
MQILYPAPKRKTEGRQTRLPRQRLQVLAQHLHDLGARATFELLLELVTAHGTDVIDRLEEYRRLDPAIVSAVGGDHFPPQPIRMVRP